MDARAQTRTWVWRPDPARAGHPAATQAGRPVYGFGPVDADGYVEVVLQDGARVRAAPGELVAE